MADYSLLDHIPAQGELPRRIEHTEQDFKKSKKIPPDQAPEIFFVTKIS